MDAWSSPNHSAFMEFCVHLKRDGKPLSMLLDLVEVAKSHTGVKLAVVFSKMLEDFKISAKILSITCDNTTNNTMMIDELENLAPGLEGLLDTRDASFIS
ncbi:hypothetical protein V8E55_010448 [Tylopilus felleus]